MKNLYIHRAKRDEINRIILLNVEGKWKCKLFSSFSGSRQKTSNVQTSWRSWWPLLTTKIIIFFFNIQSMKLETFFCTELRNNSENTQIRSEKISIRLTWWWWWINFQFLHVLFRGYFLTTTATTTTMGTLNIELILETKKIKINSINP